MKVSLFAVIGMLIGFSVVLLGHKADWLMTSVFKNNLLGFLLFGSYFFLLGIAGLVGLYFDMAEFKKMVREHSIVNSIAVIVGLLLGFFMAALCKKNGMYAGGFLFADVVFAGFGWMIYSNEVDICNGCPSGDEKMKRNVTLLSATALVIGSVTLSFAWVDACQCKILTF